MNKFYEILMNLATPRLEAYGYDLEPSLGYRDLSYVYRKDSGDNISAEIKVERQSQEEQVIGYGFRIRLRRRKPLGEGEWYEGYLDTTLDNLQRDLLGEEVRSTWWFIKGPDECKKRLAERLEFLEQYGIPWLEDPGSRPEGYISPALRDQFTKSVISLARPILLNKGYVPSDQFVLYSVFFRKELPKKRFAHIRFHQFQFPKQEMLGFTIHLLRNHSPDGLAFVSGDSMKVYEVFQELSALLWDDLGLRIYPSGHYFWEYSNQGGLDRQIKDAVEQLEKYGIQWLEESKSRHEYS